MLIIQTTDGLSTANSYVSADELNTYTTQRGIVLTKDAEQILLRAMDYIESKQYKSETVNSTQSTLFPRMGVDIPRNIKQAQILLAVLSDTQDLMSATVEAQTKKEKVDVVEVEYFESANAVTGSHSLNR